MCLYIASWDHHVWEDCGFTFVVWLSCIVFQFVPNLKQMEQWSGLRLSGARILSCSRWINLWIPTSQQLDSLECLTILCICYRGNQTSRNAPVQIDGNGWAAYWRIFYTCSPENQTSRNARVRISGKGWAANRPMSALVLWEIKPVEMLESELVE